jgi:tetratricopeptide (TPR) repeat protein
MRDAAMKKSRSRAAANPATASITVADQHATETPGGRAMAVSARWRKFWFAAFTVLGIFLALELLLWACGVPPLSQHRDTYAGFTPQVRHYQVEVDDKGTEWVAPAPTKRETLNDQRFPRRKASGTYRIVCLGGSAVYGRPFLDDTSFPGWLRVLLSRANASRRWEVINAGAISYASYRIKGLMAELSVYEPDLFIVYAGENEFLERRTYDDVFQTHGLIRGAAGLASRLRIATITEQGLKLAGLVRPADGLTNSRIKDNVTHIKVNAVGPEAYHRDEDFRRQVLTHCEGSLVAMVRMASEAKAGVLFVTSASNLRDFAPFKSEHRAGLSAQQGQAWSRAYEQGMSRLRAGQPSGAIEQFDAALAIDDRHADLLYREGQALLALGRDEEARRALERARDKDICPLRAQAATLEVMRKVAREHGVPLLDFEPLARARAARQLPGDDLFCDHVHFQIAASRMLALDILDRLAEQRIATIAPAWGEADIDEVRREVEAGIDRPRQARELCSLSRLLDRLNQPEQALKRVQEGLAIGGGDLQGLCLAAGFQRTLGRKKEAEESYRQALRLQPDAAPAEEGLGALLLDQGNLPQALEHLEAAAHRAPESAGVLNLLGVAQARLGHAEKAVPLLRHAAGLLPGEPAIQRNLALAEEALGRRSEAVRHFREALRLNPGDSAASMALQRLLASGNRREQGQ